MTQGSELMNTEAHRKEVGRNIRNIRKKLGLSMDDFAKRIDEKARSGTVSNWETGKNLPNNERMKRIAELGGVTVDELMLSEADLSFGKIIKAIREEKGFSVEDVAERGNIEPKYITQIEKGLRDVPSPRVLNNFSKGLGVPWMFLMAKAKHFKELFKNHLSEDLIELRKEHDLTVKELSEKSNVPISTIELIERGYSTVTELEYVPNPNELEKILQVYDMSLDDLFNRSIINEDYYRSSYNDYLNNSSYLYPISDSKVEPLDVDENVDILRFLDEKKHKIDMGSTEIVLIPTYKNKRVDNEDLENIKKLIEVYFKD